MINLIKSDFYKLFRSKGFYIFTILSIAFALIALFSANFTYNEVQNMVNTATSPEAQESFSELLGEKPNLVNQIPGAFTNLIFISIAVTLFITLDFSSGVIKNIVSRVSRREYIFFSKFITAIFITFVMLVVSFLTTLFGSLALWGPCDLPQNFYPELLRMCGLEFLAFIAITSVFTIISLLIEKYGGAVAVNICIISLSGMILALISLIINKVLKSEFSINDYWVFDYPSALASYTLETDVIVRCSLVSVATIAVMTLLGILLMRRKEIK